MLIVEKLKNNARTLMKKLPQGDNQCTVNYEDHRFQYYYIIQIELNFNLVIRL